MKEKDETVSYFENTTQPMSTDNVYKSIKKRILKLELEPGQKVSENQMCKEYNVSRSVIRTVFTRLNQLKLVEVYPQRGTYVSLIDLDHIESLLMLRTAVEKEVLYEMFSKLDRSDRLALVEKLEENLNKQKKYGTYKNYEVEFQSLDSEFHKILLDSVKRYKLLELLNDQMIHIARWRNFNVAVEDRMHELIDEHKHIIEAIKSDNLLSAQENMARHLKTISRSNDKVKLKYPQYFTR